MSFTSLFSSHKKYKKDQTKSSGAGCINKKCRLVSSTSSCSSQHLTNKCGQMSSLKFPPAVGRRRDDYLQVFHVGRLSERKQKTDRQKVYFLSIDILHFDPHLHQQRLSHGNWTKRGSPVAMTTYGQQSKTQVKETLNVTFLKSVLQIWSDLPDVKKVWGS